MAITKRGVYHNLKQSKYTVSNSEIVFFFSSEFTMNKFLINYQINRVEFNKRMDKLISDCPLNMDMLADIKLYENSEKRGFRAWLKGVDIKVNDLYQYSLRKMTENETFHWNVIETPELSERVKIMR